MESAPRTYLPLRQVNWLLVLAFIAGNTLCLFAYRQLEFVATGLSRPALLTLLEEVVGGLAGFCVFPLIYLVAIRFPLRSPRWRRYLLVHLLAVCLISLVHTTLIAIFRVIVFPVFGFGGVSYGYMPARYPMEFAHLFIYYWVMVSLIYLFHEIRFAREREVSQAKLEASLSAAQLQNLRLQLEPHFLFNALNAISAAIYEDPRVADEMIGRLSDLLRQLLKDERAQLVPLNRELDLLGLYIGIMQARFEHRLRFTTEIVDDVRCASVPQFLLQPLIENAIHHGMDPITFEVDIQLTAHRTSDGRLLLTVKDKGPGLDPEIPLREGIGVRNTRERLAHLYGDHQTFSIENARGGSGALVTLLLPYSESGAL